MRVKVCVHGRKETCYEAGKAAGLTDEQLKMFVFAACEHCIEYEVDEKGGATPVCLDGKTLMEFGDAFPTT